jgi:hypothetical protein
MRERPNRTVSKALLSGLFRLFESPDVCWNRRNRPPNRLLSPESAAVCGTGYGMDLRPRVFLTRPLTWSYTPKVQRFSDRMTQKGEFSAATLGVGL